MINTAGFNTLLRAALDKAREQEKADGCWECAFADVEEWQMPCSRCKRNCKDYWRPAREEGEEDGEKET